MQATFNSKERWEISIGRHKHIISGEEAKAILTAGEARFVKFRDLVVNPAFVQDMVLIESNQPKLPPEPIQIQKNDNTWEEYRPDY